MQPSNHAPATVPKPAGAVVSVELVPGGADPQTGTIRGIGFEISDATMAGATIVVASPGLQKEKVAIADNDGKFILESLPPGHYSMIVYYADRERSWELDVAAGTTSTVQIKNWPSEPVPRQHIR